VRESTFVEVSEQIKVVRFLRNTVYKQAVGGLPPWYAPPLSSLGGRRSTLHRRADRRACRRQRSSRFPVPRWI